MSRIVTYFMRAVCYLPLLLLCSQLCYGQNIDSLRMAAEQGLAEAQYSLGFCYHLGLGVTKDEAEAVRWHRMAAEQGLAEAQYCFGFCYYFGVGVAEDKAEAVKWYRLAAEQGYDMAQYDLGVCYDSGLGVAEDKAEAAKWYGLAAEQGYDMAQYDLGVCYDLGEGVAEDKAEAAKWFRLAAEQGYDRAQYNLGVCYDLGEGVAEDKAEAFRWYRLAAEQGDYRAQYNLGACYGLGEGVAEDKAEAVRWYRKAAEQGFAEAQDYLGFCYDSGLGVSEDKAEAVKWYRLAAEQGRAEAQYSLGLCYNLGEGVTEDKAEAVRWWRLAAEQGNDKAQYVLGICYDLGEGVAEDKAEAIKWWKLSADQGNSKAQKDLGDCYYHGNGVEKNLRMAHQYYCYCLASYPDLAGVVSLLEAEIGSQSRKLDEKRCAILIGNSRYENYRDLPCSEMDIDMLSKGLSKRGFRIFRIENASRKQMFYRMKAIEDTLSNEGYTFNILYYSGHGCEKNGICYMMPSDFNPKEYNPLAGSIEQYCYSFNYASAQVHKHGVILSFFDACRTYLTDGNDEQWKGYGAIPKNSCYVYAVQSGEYAIGSTSSCSPYTEAFCDKLNAKDKVPFIIFINSLNEEVEKRLGRIPVVSMSFISSDYSSYSFGKK